MAKIFAVKERFLFSKAYTKGKCFPGKYFAVYCLPNYRSKVTKLGITTSKKLGKAVRRSRVRRLAREAFSIIMKNYSFQRPYIVIVVARSAAFCKNVKMQDIVSDFENSFSQIGAFTSEIKN